MIATGKHHKNGKPFCPYCGSPNVREIGKEGTGKHRHVCLSYNCVEVAKKKLERRGVFLNTPDKQL